MSSHAAQDLRNSAYIPEQVLRSLTDYSLNFSGLWCWHINCMMLIDEIRLAATGRLGVSNSTRQQERIR
jgi:hypothetical protein